MDSVMKSFAPVGRRERADTGVMETPRAAAAASGEEAMPLG
jgi:hypothetical protein